MSRDELLIELRKNANKDGTVQFNFSSDLAVKKHELEILKSLENDLYIQRLAIALGYAIYRIL